jgi:hypothetical protein
MNNKKPTQKTIDWASGTTLKTGGEFTWSGSVNSSCSSSEIVVCTFSFGHCVACSSSIYGFWLPFGIFKVFFWPLCCLFFFDLRILITPLLSSSFLIMGSSSLTLFKKRQTKTLCNRWIHMCNYPASMYNTFWD